MEDFNSFFIHSKSSLWALHINATSDLNETWVVSGIKNNSSFISDLIYLSARIPCSGLIHSWSAISSSWYLSNTLLYFRLPTILVSDFISLISSFLAIIPISWSNALYINATSSSSLNWSTLFISWYIYSIISIECCIPCIV